MSTTSTGAPKWFPKGIAGRHVLWGLIAFFGVMFIANGFLVYYAVSTFSGGERPNPYRSGLNYNQTIAEAERQTELGWETKLDYDKAARTITLRFLDKENLPVSGLNLSAKLMRPAERREDRVLEFQEWSNGRYVSKVMLDPGNWVVSVVSSKGEGGAPVHRLKQRVYVADES